MDEVVQTVTPEKGFNPGPDEEDQTYPQGPD